MKKYIAFDWTQGNKFRHVSISIEKSFLLIKSIQKKRNFYLGEVELVL